MSAWPSPHTKWLLPTPGGPNRSTLAPRTSDSAVLVGLAGVAAAGAHAVVAAQVVVAARKLLRLGQVVERRRQAVRSVLLGRAAQAPQRGLQPGRQRQEALAVCDHDGMAPARVGERELVLAAAATCVSLLRCCLYLCTWQHARPR